MRISDHISYREATFSATAQRLGIDNTPGKWELINMQVVAMKCFEPLRSWYGQPIRINSFYRSPELNRAVKGSKTSQHIKGQAIDMDAGSEVENEKLFKWCKTHLIFDQLINEYDFSWVHISFVAGDNRNQSFKVG